MVQTEARIRIFSDPEQLGRAAGEEFLRRARSAVGQCGRFTVALSGGSTPRRVFRELAAADGRGEPVPWDRIHLFWGDERAVAPDHPDSNFGSARDILLSRIEIPDQNIHRIPTELEPGEAAAAYEGQLRGFFGLRGEEFPRFDLILLGMGEDGHTASLFPDTPALRETRRLVVANRVEKIEATRITLTFPVLNGAACVLFLVTGTGKAETLREVLRGRPRPDRLPAQAVRPGSGELLWWVDAAAAAKLDDVVD